MLKIKNFPEKDRKNFKKIIEKMIKTRQNYETLLKEATTKLKETKKLRKSTTKQHPQDKTQLMKLGGNLNIQMIEEENSDILTESHSFSISNLSSRMMSSHPSLNQRQFHNAKSKHDLLIVD
jgi:hypothetical protein